LLARVIVPAVTGQMAAAGAVIITYSGPDLDHRRSSLKNREKVEAPDKTAPVK